MSYIPAVLLSHVLLLHLAHCSFAGQLKPGRASALLVLALVLLALQNSLIYHGKRLWENQLSQNRVQQQLHYPCMWREGSNSQRSAVLNAAARGWQNRNKRLTGSWGHVLLKLRLGERWWWEEQETQAAFFPSLSLSVWSSEGSAVQWSTF